MDVTLVDVPFLPVVKLLESISQVLNAEQLVLIHRRSYELRETYLSTFISVNVQEYTFHLLLGNFFAHISFEIFKKILLANYPIFVFINFVKGMVHAQRKFIFEKLRNNVGVHYLSDSLSCTEPRQLFY